MVLTVGMKAPRWPEYHIPSWAMKKVPRRFGSVVSRNQFLQQRTLNFIEQIIRRYKEKPIVKYWQVENEALNRFGGRQWRMDKDFLKKEIELIQDLDSRPIILTASTYPNNLLRILSKIFTNTRPIRDNLELCDILGINVYPLIGQKYWGRKWYFRSRENSRIQHLREIFNQAREIKKEIWVTELQAEPWEPGEIVYKGKKAPPTGSPQTTKETLEELRVIGYRTFLFWGAEYWYYQETLLKDSTWSNVIKELMNRYKQKNFSPS